MEVRFYQSNYIYKTVDSEGKHEKTCLPFTENMRHYCGWIRDAVLYFDKDYGYVFKQEDTGSLWSPDWCEVIDVDKSAKKIEEEKDPLNVIKKKEELLKSLQQENEELKAKIKEL